MNSLINLALVIVDVPRCFVEPSMADFVSKCSFNVCMENRRLAVLNKKEFTCKHLAQVVTSRQENKVKRYMVDCMLSTLVILVLSNLSNLLHKWYLVVDYPL